MKNLRVSMKLLISFGILIIMLIVLTSVSSLGIRNISDILDVIYNSDMNGVNLVNSLNIRVEEITRNTLTAAAMKTLVSRFTLRKQ